MNLSTAILAASMEGIFSGQPYPMVPYIKKGSTAKPVGHAQIRRARKLERHNKRKGRAAKK